MNYKTDCPKCGGNDFYVTPSNGMGYCFHCGYLERADKKSDSAEYEIKTSIEAIRYVYTMLTEYYHSSLTDSARIYLNSRGFDDATITKFKLGYIPNDVPTHLHKDALRDSGLYVNNKAVLGERISFPYIVGDKVTDIRGRSMDKNEPTRYKSPLGSSGNRGAIFPYNECDMRHDHIVTEGEIKAIMSHQFGVPCVALPGISSWRPKVSQTSAKQTIVFDSTKNRVTREITFRAIDKTAKMLYNPYVVVLPLLGEDKMDIDSFILRRGAVEFKTIIDNALPYSEWAKLQRRNNVY